MQHTPLGYCCRGREKGLTIYQLHNILGHAISNQNSTINPIRPFQFTCYFLVLPISQEPCAGRAAKLLDRKRLLSVFCVIVLQVGRALAEISFMQKKVKVYATLETLMWIHQRAPQACTPSATEGLIINSSIPWEGTKPAMLVTVPPYSEVYMPTPL